MRKENSNLNPAYIEALQQLSDKQKDVFLFGSWDILEEMSFVSWLKKVYPTISLMPWQLKVAKMFSKPIGSGKTFLIKLLNEYDNERK